MISQRVFREGLAAAVMLTLVLFLGAGCNSDDRPLTIKIIVDNASDLREGDDVRIAKLKVGEVRGFDFTQDNRIATIVEIQPQYRDRITTDSLHRIKREGLLSKSRYVEITPGTGDPVADDAVFYAQDDVDELKRHAKNLWDRVKAKAEDPETQEKLRQFGEEAKKAAESGLEEWEKQRPELEAKARELIEKAEDSEATEKLKQELGKFLNQMEEKLVADDSTAAASPE